MPGNVLAVRLPNWVGDVCMALPALHRLRAAGCDLRLFGRGWARDLLAGTGWSVHALPKGLRAGARALAGSGAERGLLLTNSFGSALQMRWAGIPAIGYRGDWRSWLLATPVRKTAGGHEVEAFWRLALVATGAGATGAASSVPPDRLDLPLADRHRSEAAAALAGAATALACLGPVDRYVVLCPFAAGTINGVSKVWPSWPAFSRALAEQGIAQVVCPGPDEAAACATAVPAATPLTGLGLGAYAAVLAGASVVVANDSGPMHLAAAVGAPVVGVFGVSDPTRTRPWTRRGVAVGGDDPRTRWPSIATVWEAVQRLRGG